MAMEWQITMKPAFLNDMKGLPAKEVYQMMAKLQLLMQDPLPDGKVKKQLKYMDNNKLCRIRAGDYRIFYVIGKQSINILTMRRRSNATYKQEVDDDLDVDTHEDLDIDFDETTPPAKGPSPDWFGFVQSPMKPLPEPITVELLKRLRVPSAYHARLLPLMTQDALLECPGVPDDVLLTIDQYMFETPLQQVMQQPDLVLNGPEDLQRYKEGELLAFLLKLSPEQEKYAQWPLHASGPMLVKGGPGTGKSTVALYRIRSLLQQLRKAGVSSPELLFTTYTNALVKSSEQLLQQLLGDNARYVRVRTADKIVYEVLQSAGQLREIVKQDELQRLVRQAVVGTPLIGNALQQQAQRQTLEKIGYEYLLQEFNMVIVARQLVTVEEYQATPRAGRKVRLNASQRALVWRIYERWCELLQASGKATWQQRRALAEELVESGEERARYDAVIIDEAQDLDPSVLRLLVKLCKAPSRIFVTADANQSIYGSGFTWSDVHDSLKFQGRTSILRANYRSTREIGEAAQSYLAYGVLEAEVIERVYINGGSLPDVRAVYASEHELQLLATFCKKASRELRLTLGSCAVLCPSQQVGRTIAAALSEQGLEASFMTGLELDLKRSGIKVMTLSSAKGLEFPAVALAGFVGSSYPIIPREASDDERNELLARERRTMFVGMTRAMRALLVIVPANPQTTLLEGFDGTYWNTGS